MPAYVNGSTPPRASVSAAVSAPARTVLTAPTSRAAAESNAPRQRRPIQETADLADEIEAMHPEISQTELARRLGISATRLRAVRREAREARRAAARQLAPHDSNPATPEHGRGAPRGAPLPCRSLTWIGGG